MTPTQTPATAPTGRRRRGLSPVPAPHFAESVHQAHLAHQAPQDPPLYRALLATWAEYGKTLPGRHDPEWARLVAPTVRTGQFSGSRGY
ncbi:hypothetical protein [Streptomyces sp. NPDC016845]|uniref:hypothetical protein n=1 Tax=Streptomyces sp. NPDC016845 TaxID=3364972 RepID=UPI00378C30FE